MSLFAALRRFAAGVERAVECLRDEYTPRPPAEFTEKVRWWRARPRAFTERRAVELFILAEPRFRWRTRGSNIRQRRSQFTKPLGDRYIVRCLREAATIPGWTVRSRIGRPTLAEAMGEAFGEDARTIERAWHRRH